MSPQPGRLHPFAGSLTIEHEPGGQRVLCLSGDVDSATVAGFEARQGRAPVVVDAIDAGAVSFLGSAGLAVMVRFAEAAGGAGRFPVLRAASSQVDRLLHAAGLESYFLRPGATQNETGSSSTP
jgi:anti-anti-sigma factor